MLNNSMKQIHIIYKTEDDEGNYYIGRHSTDNINDGYLGSGNWISTQDKSKLKRTVQEKVDSVELVIQKEQEYLNEHFGKAKCMNKNPKSTGFATGKHNPNANGQNAKTAIKNGKHINQTNNPSKTRSAKGIHQWQHGKAPNAGGKLNKKLIEEGRHNFLGPDLNNKRIEEGTHNLLGSKSNLDRLANGTHPSQQKKTCEHCGKTASVGMYARWHGDHCSHR